MEGELMPGLKGVAFDTELGCYVTVEELVAPRVHDALDQAGLEVVLRAVLSWAKKRQFTRHKVYRDLWNTYEGYLKRYGGRRWTQRKRYDKR